MLVKRHGLILILFTRQCRDTIATALETIDRIGPCTAIIKVLEIQDIRLEIVVVTDKNFIGFSYQWRISTKSVVEEVRSVLTTGQAGNFHGLTAGPT